MTNCHSTRASPINSAPAGHQEDKGLKIITQGPLSRHCQKSWDQNLPARVIFFYQLYTMTLRDSNIYYSLNVDIVIQFFFVFMWKLRASAIQVKSHVMCVCVCVCIHMVTLSQNR